MSCPSHSLCHIVEVKLHFGETRFLHRGSDQPRRCCFRTDLLLHDGFFSCYHRTRPCQLEYPDRGGGEGVAGTCMFVPLSFFRWQLCFYHHASISHPRPPSPSFLFASMPCFPCPPCTDQCRAKASGTGRCRAGGRGHRKALYRTHRRQAVGVTATATATGGKDGSAETAKRQRLSPSALCRRVRMCFCCVCTGALAWTSQNVKSTRSSVRRRLLSLC